MLEITGADIFTAKEIAKALFGEDDLHSTVRAGMLLSHAGVQALNRGRAVRLSPTSNGRVIWSTSPEKYATPRNIREGMSSRTTPVEATWDGALSHPAPRSNQPGVQDTLAKRVNELTEEVKKLTAALGAHGL